MKLSSYLMIDLRNYSQYIVKTHPREALKTLHTYYTLVDRLANLNGGWLCSALGDATGSFFTEKGHALQAIKAAVSILSFLRTNSFPLNVSAGIASGEIILDVVKSSRISTISPVGKPIIEAYRVEDLAAANKHDILITGITNDLLPIKIRHQFKSQGSHHLKNISYPVHVYSSEIQRLLDILQL